MRVDTVVREGNASGIRRPTRVALVTNTPVPYRVPALRMLAEMPGIELEVIYCTTPHIDATLDEVAHGFEPRLLSGRYRAYERRFMHADTGVFRLLSEIKPDVVITTGYIPTFLFAFAWARWNGAAHLAMTDGTLASERSLSWVHRLIRSFVLARSAACIGACEGSMALFRSYAVPEAHLFKSPLAIDNTRFEDTSAEPKQVDFLFCGRFVKHKRPEFVLDVCAAVAKRLGREVSVDFVGAGVEEATLRQHAESLAGSVRARFLGYVNQLELPQRYAAARVFLFPSEWDPWGVVANEACASGIPVIVSPHAGAAGELVRDGENGFVRELDLVLWTDAAVALLSDETLRQRMGLRGRELVKNFSFSTAARGLASAVGHAKHAVAGKNDAPLIITSLMAPDGTTGVQTHVNALAAYLDSAGSPWRLVTPFDGPRLMLYAFVGIRSVLHRTSPAAAVWLYRAGHAWLLRRALRPLLRDAGTCAIYAQCPVSANVALSARANRLQTVSMVVHFNVSQADEWAGKGDIAVGGWMYHAIRAFEQQVMPRLDALVFVSAHMRDQVMARIPAVAWVPQEIIPNFVADPAPAVPSQFDADLIAVGTLEPRKNQGYLLEILAAARTRGQILTLTLVGNGQDRAVLETQAKTLGVADQVRFAGFVANGSRLIAHHRACVHVALMENLPVTLIEALSWARPVFAPAVGGVLEVFDDGIEGRVLPLNDASRAAEILCDALSDTAAMERMSQAARARFLNGFERSQVGARLCHFVGVGASSHITAKRRPNVMIVQSRITHYRVSVFERLRIELDKRGINLRVAYSNIQSGKTGMNRDDGFLSWGTPVPARDILEGVAIWQDLRVAMGETDLVVLMQENRMLFNYVVPWLYPRVRWAFFGHGRHFQAGETLALADRFKRWYLGYAHWWFVYTDLTAKTVAETGYPRERITVFNNAIDNEALTRNLASVTDDALSARMDEWGIGSGPAGLMLGTLYAPKRLEFMLRVAARIRERIPAFQLLIVGDGPQREQASVAAQQSGGWIHWLGALKGLDKAFALKRAEILLNPGMVGLAILDGFAAGVPMVTCDLPFHSPEIAYLNNGRNGLVTANDEGVFAEAVIDLINNPERRAAMRSACREDAQEYTMAHMVTRLCDGIVECLESSTPTQ